MRMVEVHVFFSLISSLRDTGITDLLHAGVDPLTVQHHVDHSSLAIQSIYTNHFDTGVNDKVFNSGVEF